LRQCAPGRAAKRLANALAASQHRSTRRSTPRRPRFLRAAYRTKARARR
jgi:hypothetical protein